MKSPMKKLGALKYLLLVIGAFVLVGSSAPAVHALVPPDPTTPPPSEPTTPPPSEPAPGTTPAAANTDEVKNGLNQVGGKEAGNDGNALTGIIKNIIDILLFLIGTISVIMIIVGGIRYSTSNGDQAQITSAKNTVLYAIVGVVVALMAFALVNFVVGRL